MTPELAQAIEQAVWYPYNTLPQLAGETVHAWIVRAVIATVEPTLAEHAEGAWRDYTLEPHGEHPGVAALCRSDDLCMDAQLNEDGRYLTLGEAVDWAQRHVRDHAEHDGQVPA